MGDWVQMGVKKQSLYQFFLKYTVQICVNTVLIVGLLVLLAALSGVSGLILPANYAEVQLKKDREMLMQVSVISREMIPPYCTYGVYEENGKWLYGNFPKDIRKQNWENFETDTKYAPDGKYFFFIERNNGEVCIVKYALKAYFAGNHPVLNRIGPENMLPLIFLVLFLFQVILSSRIFSKRLRHRLLALNRATEKIGNNNLDFEREDSDIKEIAEVLGSLEHLRKSLKTSLEEQWEMEIKREEELSALAHDIKTPVTIIKGNAELLEEEELNEEQREYSGTILKNVEQIEQYLQAMRQVIQNEFPKEKTEIIDGEALLEAFIKKAEEIATAENIKLSAEKCWGDCKVKGNRKELLRAWENLVGNAVSYTDKEKGIYVLAEIKKRAGKTFLVMEVSDYGAGFSKEDLVHGTERFYRGDKSRHGNGHQGLGLFIASNIVKEQGGSLILKNSEKTKGAQAQLWILTEGEKEGQRDE